MLCVYKDKTCNRLYWRYHTDSDINYKPRVVYFYIFYEIFSHCFDKSGIWCHETPYYLPVNKNHSSHISITYTYQRFFGDDFLRNIWIHVKCRILNKSDVKRWNTLGCLDLYTAPKSKYTGGEYPTPTNGGECSPQMQVNAVKDGPCIYSCGQTGQ